MFLFVPDVLCPAVFHAFHALVIIGASLNSQALRLFVLPVLQSRQQGTREWVGESHHELLRKFLES